MSQEISVEISQHHEIDVYDKMVVNATMCENRINLNKESTNSRSVSSGPR